jgi:hypothetical protein
VKDGDFFTLAEIHTMLRKTTKGHKTRPPKSSKRPLRPSCKSCGAYMAWGTDKKPECPFCDGGAGD